MPFLANTAIMAALAFLAVPPAAEGNAARIELTEDGLVWLRGGESLKRIDPRGRRVPASVPAVEGKLLDFAVTPDGAALFRLVESKGKFSTLVAHVPSSGAGIGRWEIRMLGRSLTMAPDATALAIVGPRPGARKKPRPDDWTLALLDIVTGEMTGPRALGYAPHGISIFENAAGRPTLFLATEDRILTYALSPLKASRFYTSPGRNVAVAGTGRSPVIYLLRDSAFAVIDPSRWSRAGGRILLSSDDATSVIELDTPGIALALSGDGSAAFVLHEDRMSLSVIDTGTAEVIETRRLEDERDLMAGPTSDGRIVLASSDPEASPALTTISTPPAPARAARAPPPEEEPVPEPTPVPDPPPAPVEEETGTPAPGATAPEERAPGPGPEPEPPPAPEPPPEPVPEPVPEPEPEPEPPPAREADPGTGPEPRPGQPGQEASTDPEPPAEETPRGTAPPGPPPPPERKAPSGPGLSGTISGEPGAAKEVLLYGPDNLLRLAARAAVAGDGTFRFDLPPPGSYRLIVSGGPDGQIFTNPRFRKVVVEEGGTGATGLDFTIVGRL